ncbi:hypothetical protein BN1048_02247 [Jeotgalicoccus saudimassiliensis]|uniref:Uncharacterized protein n=1 Tax=Jeotgalicoccus saudimassiliensis TaxID=1461582 RepID=A0A078MEL6_9STAP|nr:hypothetical protein [Jeotgalicoccus saudimassiliensis]CEA03897.1 hypothetical protein BN1048_02247 [Jeotgalicoccus saudimassiliensis]
MTAYRHRDFNSVYRFMAAGAVIGIILGIITGLIFGHTAFWILAGLALGISGGAAVEGSLHRPTHNKEG